MSKHDYKYFSKIVFCAAAGIFALVTFSCRTTEIVVPPLPIPISRTITDPGVKTADQLANFFLDNNPSFSRDYIVSFAGMYVEEAGMEGINSDIAFAQMCLETGFLRFGNLVTPGMHNYCGLGSIDAEHPGEVFLTERLGIRAQIQHLQAYSTVNAELTNPVIDKRYKWVKRGRAPTIFGLAGTWAADPAYGRKLDTLLSKMELY